VTALASVVGRAEPLRWLLAPILPVATAVSLIPLRGSMHPANVALVLVLAVVAVAVVVGREAGMAAAIVSALSFDFFHTRPYLHLSIASGDDVQTAVLLAVVGLTVGQLAARGRESRRAAAARRDEVRRIYRIAEQAAHGDDVSDVIMASQAELLGLLGLRDCRFEAPPFSTALDRIERDGLVSWSEYRLRGSGFELPAAGVELPVRGQGRVLGRFVLEPTPAVGVSLEQRVVAVALADLVGLALAVPQPGSEKHRHG
jgi:hypothetical protein